MDEVDIENLEVWPIADDLAMAEAPQRSHHTKKKKDWEPLFISEGVFQPHEQPKVEDYALKDRKLRMLG